MAELGKLNTLTMLRETRSGAFLDGEQLGEILLPGKCLPEGLSCGSTIEVFLYLDSEDRLVATTDRPRALVGEFAGMEVVGVHPRIGAFLDWGLDKDLLLPFREQGTRRVRTGERVVVYVFVDERSERIVATMRWNRFLRGDRPGYKAGDRRDILIAERTELGYKAIVENAYSGLLYHSNLGSELEIGTTMPAYVKTVRPDGRLDLSLDASGPDRVEELSRKILEALEAGGGRFEFDDSSSPEVIRKHFNTSKKAFKQALGALYRKRRIRFVAGGGVELTPD